MRESERVEYKRALNQAIRAWSNDPDEQPDESAAARLELLWSDAVGYCADALGLDPPAGGAVCLTREEWGRRTVQDYLPVLEARVALWMSAEGWTVDPRWADLIKGMEALPGGMSSIFAYVDGSLVGHLTSRSLGPYPIAMPRPAALPAPLLPANISRFSSEWELTSAQVEGFVTTYHAALHVLLHQPAVRSRLLALLDEYFTRLAGDERLWEASLVEGLRRQPGAISVDSDALRAGLTDGPTRETALELVALSEMLDATAWTLIEHAPGFELVPVLGRLQQIFRRARAESGSADRLLETMLGLPLEPIVSERALAFASGVVDVVGFSRLGAIWAEQGQVPERAFADPQTWLAQIGFSPKELARFERQWSARPEPILDGARGAAALGGRPPFGRRDVTTVKLRARTREDLERHTKRRLLSERQGSFEAEVLAGRLQGMAWTGHAPIRPPGQPFDGPRLGGLLAGHLMSQVLEERGALDRDLEQLCELYALQLATPSIQKFLETHTDERRIAVIHTAACDGLHRVGADPDRDQELLLLGWLCDQAGAQQTPTLLTLWASYRSIRLSKQDPGSKQ
jgi:uncharacterized protein (DUF2342 family)